MIGHHNPQVTLSTTLYEQKTIASAVPVVRLVGPTVLVVEAAALVFGMNDGVGRGGPLDLCGCGHGDGREEE